MNIGSVICIGVLNMLRLRKFDLTKDRAIKSMSKLSHQVQEDYANNARCINAIIDLYDESNEELKPDGKECILSLLKLLELLLVMDKLLENHKGELDEGFAKDQTKEIAANRRYIEHAIATKKHQPPPKPQSTPRQGLKKFNPFKDGSSTYSIDDMHKLNGNIKNKYTDRIALINKCVNDLNNESKSSAERHYALSCISDMLHDMEEILDMHKRELPDSFVRGQSKAIAAYRKCAEGC